ncbi:hypothetical protein GC387_05475 [Pseudomonas sp. MWU12-2323]|nr:hypothetical protein [Pseudomonas sp. MWU12-2323]RBH55612.1 hypothetical protein C3F00_019285 [Pseudomonas sp. MWU13-2860]
MSYSCGSRLAGDEASEPCIAGSDAIAGKPAPSSGFYERAMAASAESLPAPSISTASVPPNRARANS